jgi:hypothetical protein
MLVATFHLTFYCRQDAKCAMKEFQENLRTMTTRLDSGSATESPTLPDTHRSVKLFLQSLLHLPSTGQRTVVSDLNESRLDILDNRQKIKRAFKLLWNLWNLYTIAQQQENAGSAFSLGRNTVKPVAEALDAVSWEFIGHPFGISRPSGSFSLSVLNCDDHAASRKEELARQLGKCWIDDRVNRHHVPANQLIDDCANQHHDAANQLIDVQITLFELIWSGTIQQLRANPTLSTSDPEYKEFEQILGQLDNSLQEVIARSRRPRFTLSFYGMVKAGKSLFLNALIGKTVLPSNGRYP